MPKPCLPTGQARVSSVERYRMLLGGEPLGERFIWWNFVSSRKERIEQAKADWKEGRIIPPPIDNKEFIPLPEDCSRPSASPAHEHFS